MTRGERALLAEVVGAKDSYTDRKCRWPAVSTLVDKGLVTMRETLIAVKGVGLVPAPCLIATDFGRQVHANQV